MIHKEQLEKIKALTHDLESALREIENGGNVAFFKAFIQKKAIEIYDTISHLNDVEELTEKKGPEIKIISQLEVLKKSNPEPEKKEVPEIIGQDINKETVTKEIAKEKSTQEIPPVESKAETPEPPVSTAKPVNKVENSSSDAIKNETLVTEKENPIQEVKPGNALEDFSLNDKLSKNIKPVINIAEKSKEVPIKDLIKAISISKKFEFIKVLFNGNSDAYKNTLNIVQNANNHEEAIQYIHHNVINNFDWKNEESEPLAGEFYNLIKRRHLN